MINFNVKADVNIVINVTGKETEISKQDQKILDSILTRFGALVRKLQAVDALTPPGKKL